MGIAGIFIVFTVFSAGLVYGDDAPIRIDFSGTTAEANGVLLQGPGFGEYPLALVSFGEIPTSNAFPDATDGRGVTVSAGPGEGVLVLGREIHTTNAAAIRCTVRTNTAHAAVTLAAVDSGKSQFISTSSPHNGEYWMGQYRRIEVFFVPPSTGFRPLIQVLNTSSGEPLTAYIDNLDVYLLDPLRYYHAQFLDGDETDPSPISIPIGSGMPGSGSRLSVEPPCAVFDIGKTALFRSGYIIDGQGLIHWRVEKNYAVAIDAPGIVRGVSGGNGWVSAQFGTENGRALAFVNPVPSYHADRSYEWYRTQMGTGAASYNNCGPASTQMVIRWHSGREIPVSEIRNLAPRDNGWWYTNDVTNALEAFGIPYAIHPAADAADIQACLKRGHIVILCAEMKWIGYNRQPFYGRFYAYDSGHFFVVKGSSSDGHYLVVYDPNAWSGDYDEQGVMLGRNRYYLSSEVTDAIRPWWPYAIVIGESSDTSAIQRMSIPVGKAGPGMPDREIEKK